MADLGVFVSYAKTLDATVEQARIADSLGYGSAWVIQVADREATVLACCIAAATQNIAIGTGVLPTYPRTPVVTAQTAATLDEASGGRFILGLGTSHKLTIEGWHGMQLHRPLRSMREYVEAVRAILQGQTYSGEIYRTSFQFIRYEPVRRDMPIYMSCLSPNMCELAGEVADGAILWLCAPGYIRDVVIPQIEKGRAKAGKTLEGFEIVAAVPVSITEAPDKGFEAFRKVSLVYWNLPFYRAAVEGAGFGQDLAAFDKSGPSAISESAIRSFAGIGAESDARETIESYRGAGVTVPALSYLGQHEGGLDFEQTLKTLA